VSSKTPIKSSGQPLYCCINSKVSKVVSRFGFCLADKISHASRLSDPEPAPKPPGVPAPVKVESTEIAE
jgi:hypothetical protein